MKQGVKMLNPILLTLTMIIGVSCSMVKSIGVSSTASVMKEASTEANTEANFDMFVAGMPANIKMLESLWFTNQDNENLLTLLIKGYGGLGFGVSETLYLKDSILGNADSKYKEQALYHYTKAFDYGVRYFKNKGISIENLLDKEAAGKLPSLMDKEFNDEDMLAAFYFAQSWGSLINLQRDNVFLLANLGSVKAIMDWVCKRDANFESGSCMLFYAVYEAGRPAMLGGSLEKGKEIFLNFINKYPENLLARVAYIQFYIVPMMDEVLFAKEEEFLTKEFLYWNGVRNLADRSKGTQKYLEHKEFNLYNSIAQKRFEIIVKLKNEIF